jgi:hypothetical protein
VKKAATPMATPKRRKTAPARKPAGRKSAPLSARNTTTPKMDTSLRATILRYRKQLNGTQVQILDIPWEAQFLAKNLGVKRHPNLKYYVHEGGVLPPQLEPYRSIDYSYERWIEDSINGREKTVTLPASRMKPRPHQVEAIKKIEATAKAGWRGFLLADDVGTGKSLSSIIGAYATAKVKGFTPENKAKVLIVAPKSVLPHWRNTIKASGVNNMRIVVINYDQAKKLLDAPASASDVKKTSTANMHTSQRGTPTTQWDIIIADESHKLKNVSQRTAAFANIARYGANTTTAPYIIWCSATIGQNPLELGYLAPLIAQITGFGTLTQNSWGDWLIANNFNVKKSGAGNFSWVKTLPESSPSDRALIQKQQTKDVQRLSEFLFSPTSPSIRRVPENIHGWPKQTFTPTPILLNPTETLAYKKVWQEFRKHIGLHPRGKNPQSGLAAQMRFRQKASLISALTTAEYANDLLDNGLQVAISVQFIETLDAIKSYLEKKGWHCAEISGRNVEERENERLRFQKGKAQVVLFTTLEGISLHSGEQLADGSIATKTKRAMLVHDIRYSALDMIQIVGRTTRDGQLANAYLMFTENTIETRILEVVLNRMRNVHTISGDAADSSEEIENILDTMNG